MNGANFLSKFKGYVVQSAEVGIGTFLNVRLATKDLANEGLIWIYLSNWAIVRGEDELAAFDRIEEKLIDCLNGSCVIGYEIVNEDEIHVEFSAGFSLQIWEDVEAYGNNAEAVNSLSIISTLEV